MIAARDTGSASIVLLALGLALVILGVAVADAGSILLADNRAGSAADLSALAAAENAARGEKAACEQANRVAEANRARMHSCHLDGLDAVVTVKITMPVVTRGGPDSVGASARAGPVEA